MARAKVAILREPALLRFIKSSSVQTLLALVTIGGFACAAFAAISDRDFDKAFQKLKREESLQFDLLPPLPPPTIPRWLEAIFGFIGRIIEFLAPLFVYIFWIGLAALALGAAYLIFKIFMDVQRTSKVDVDEAPPVQLYQPSQKTAHILLEEVDALAAQGRYTEAVHTLLFRSIQDIDQARPNVIRRSLTSREIGALDILSEGSRTAFSRISSIVETSFFGGQAIGATEFNQAREAYAGIAAG